MTDFFINRNTKLGVSLDKLNTEFNPAEFDKDKNNRKRIISYDPGRLFHYGFVNPVGSTVNLGVALRTLVMCGAASLAANFTCATKQKYSFCFPIVVSGEGLIFASLVSFLLGLFISTTFSRWWALREKLGTVMNNTTTLAILLKNHAPDDVETLVVRARILRLMHLAHALIYKQAINDNDFSEFLEQKMMTQSEEEAISECKDLPQSAIVYSWCMHLVKPILPKVAPAAAISPILASMTACMNASQEISAFLKTQMPYMYLHLLAFTTKVHLAFIIFYGAGIIAQGIQQTLWTRILLGYTVIITNNIIYEGLLRIHEMLYNPLGNDNADFPSHLYIASTMALGAAVEVPPPVEDSKGKDKLTIEIGE